MPQHTPTNGERVRAWLLGRLHEMHTGDELPPARSLRDAYRTATGETVSLDLMRKAVRALADDGAVHRGRGASGSAWLKGAAPDIRANLLAALENLADGGQLPGARVMADGLRVPHKRVLGELKALAAERLVEAVPYGGHRGWYKPPAPRAQRIVDPWRTALIAEIEPLGDGHPLPPTDLLATRCGAERRQIEDSLATLAAAGMVARNGDRWVRVGHRRAPARGRRQVEVAVTAPVGQLRAAAAALKVTPEVAEAHFQWAVLRRLEASELDPPPELSTYARLSSDAGKRTLRIDGPGRPTVELSVTPLDTGDYRVHKIALPGSASI